MNKILFVCLGNICRSPLAEGICKFKVKEKKIADSFYIDSAGTSGWHKGEPPHAQSIYIAGKYNIDITNQKSRPVTHSDVHTFDYFIAMDEMNKKSLIHEFSFSKNKVFKLRDFDTQDRGANVPDPYGHNNQYFEDIFHMIDKSVDNFLEYLLSI